jgi:LemA protein
LEAASCLLLSLSLGSIAPCTCQANTAVACARPSGGFWLPAAAASGYNGARHRPAAAKGVSVIAAIVIIVVVVLLGIVLAGMYNGLVKRRNQVDNAWSQIDVQLKRRHDLIPNLVEAVKDYMSYEQETLTKVTEARAAAIKAGAEGPAAQARAENALTETLRSLFAVAENYPDLKASQNVMALQEELTATENKISFARQFYNDSVMAYNIKIQQMPTNIIAGMFNFTRRDFFEAPEEDREVVKVDLR